MRLEPGLWITPTVRLVRPLGAGGMSSVWVAAHMRLHTQVAVKILSPALRNDDKSRARFRRESHLWSLIQSPYLVQTHDAGELSDGTLFVVMEWLEGETLATRLASEGPLGASDTLHIVRQLAHALSAAHGIGIVHRDLKPENLFLLSLEGPPLLKVLDWGVAKSLDENIFASEELDVVTAGDETLGTPAYMSPEQLRRAVDADQRADLWSLAVLSYRMLLGRLPFEGADYPTLCFAVVRGNFEPPTRLDPRWPASLDAWFARAFARDIRDRFADATEAAVSLEAALDAMAPGHCRGLLEEAEEGVEDPDTVPR